MCTLPAALTFYAFILGLLLRLTLLLVIIQFVEGIHLLLDFLELTTTCVCDRLRTLAIVEGVIVSGCAT